MDPNFGPGLSLAPFSNVSPGDTYTDLDPPRNNLDLDTSRPDQHGLDDTYRPSLDSNTLVKCKFFPVFYKENF